MGRRLRVPALALGGWLLLAAAAAAAPPHGAPCLLEYPAAARDRNVDDRIFFGDSLQVASACETMLVSQHTLSRAAEDAITKPLRKFMGWLGKHGGGIPPGLVNAWGQHHLTGEIKNG